MSNIKQNLRKTLAILTIVVSFLVLQVSTVFAQDALTKEVPPHNSNYYIDELDILSSETKQIINSQSRKLEEQAGTQVFVLTVDNLDEDPQSYAEKAFESYKLGNAEKDNGLLIMLARLTNGHHRVQVVTGYGLESILPDGKVGRIIDNYMVGHFLEEDYNEGILSGYSTFVNILENPDAAIANEYQDSETAEDIFGVIFLVLLFVPKLFIGILIILWNIIKGICYIFYIYPKRFFNYLSNKRKLRRGEAVKLHSKTINESPFYYSNLNSNTKYSSTFKLVDELLYSFFAGVSFVNLPFFNGDDDSWSGGGGFSGGGFSGGGGSSGGGGAGRSF